MIFRFADPWFLLLLLLVPMLAVWYWRRTRKKSATIRFSNVKSLKGLGKKSSGYLRHSLIVMRLLVLTALIVAFARPQAGVKSEEILTQGIDIVLAIDVSSSMLAEDIKPNRLEAVKEVAANFIKGRKNDRIGMVVFAGEAFTQCPLTIDYGILVQFMKELKVGMIEDGTAVGMGLATAVNRLRTSNAKSKVIILLTDGKNNRGQIDPITAAHAAQAFDIRIYAIGAGTRGTAMYPVQDPFFGKRYVPMPVDVDETTLSQIAKMTGGAYFRATDRKSLESIYKEIDEMEKTEIKVKEYTRYSEKFLIFAGFALLMLVSELVLTHTRFRKIP